MIQFNFQSTFKLTQITRIKKLINLISINEGKPIKELSIVFTSDEYLLQINKQFLDHDYYTDIITFDYSQDNATNDINGELYISVDRASENAQTYGATTQNEVIRLIIHGILHLMGYTDKQEYEKLQMTAKENHYLAAL